MERRIILQFFILIIILIQHISAGGVGISPAFYKEFFEPNLTKSFNFHSFNLNPEKNISIYVKGDLAKYVNLSKTYIAGSGSFTATINLPEKINKPGTYKISIGAIEATEGTETTVGGIAAVQGRIDIIVPYPGKYAESTFSISNINEGEEIKYKLISENLGSQELNINSTIEIYKDNISESFLTETTGRSVLKPKETLTTQGTMNTQDLPSGEYQALATIGWGQTERINRTFKVGEFLVEVIDYDYQFEQGEINSFNIQIQNKWNTKIDEVSAIVSITDEGQVVNSFKTVSIDTNPWEVKNITGYFDTTGLKAKRYTANILLSYGDKTTSKLVAIYINPSPKTTYTKYTILSSIIATVIIATFIYLILKIKRLQKQNAKKK